MPHWDTSVAIQQAIINQDTTHLALNASQGHKLSYPSSYQFSALNATQGHKSSYQQAIYIDPKWCGYDPTLLYQHRVSGLLSRRSDTRLLGSGFVNQDIVYFVQSKEAKGKWTADEKGLKWKENEQQTKKDLSERKMNSWRKRIKTKGK